MRTTATTLGLVPPASRSESTASPHLVKPPGPHDNSLEPQKLQGNIANRQAFRRTLLGEGLEKFVDLSQQARERAALPSGHRDHLSQEDYRQKIKDAIERSLNSTLMPVDPGSAYFRERDLEPGGSVSLMRFIEDNGWRVPVTHDELRNLYESLGTVAPSTPLHGNFGGALAWPVPLSHEDQLSLYYHPIQTLPGVEEDGLFKTLTRNLPLDKATLAQPRRVLERLIGSRAGQAVGEGLQRKCGGVVTASSNADWLLAALHASLDEKTLLASAPSSTRNSIAGFDLAKDEHIGKPPVTVVRALADHLAGQHTLSAELASVAAYLLLSRRAPAFLVKDIPAGVKCGSHAWVSLQVAVARLEAKAPGSTALMNYAQVMEHAEMAPITVEDQAVEYAAQQSALKDWGVANGVIPFNANDQYTASQLSTLHSAFNVQIQALRAGSEAYASEMPTRRELALTHLKQAYGSAVPFEKRCISLYRDSRDHPGPYSLLDLYLHYGNLDGVGTSWVSNSADVPLKQLSTKDRLPNIEAEFSSAFTGYCEAMDKAIATHAAHLIASLPLDDRNHLESGELTIARAISITRGGYGPFPERRTPNDHSLYLKTEHQGEVRTYVLNLKDNVIQRQDTPQWELGELLGGDGQAYGRFEKVADSPAGPAREGHPPSYTSARTALIASAMVEDAAIRRHEGEARGRTTFESEVPFHKAGREFLLNLIPFRSAIIHFEQGNIGDGIVDLTFDAFGFMLGAGAAARSVKALRAGASLGAQVARGGKIIGRAAVGALNPLDGTGALLFNLARGGQKSTLHAYRLLRGSADSYNLLEASKHFDASAVGTFKLKDAIVEGPAVLTGGKWYAFDSVNGRPYGTALDDFQPSLRSTQAQLANWGSTAPVISDSSAALRKRWAERVEQHKADDPADFLRGYNEGDPLAITGFRPAMKAEDIRRLAISAPLTPAEIGSLARQEERLAVQHGFKGVSQVYEHVSAAGGSFIPAPQVFYLSQTNPLSQGQCAAMSRLMASAMEQGTQATFIGNLFTAAANPAAQTSREFVTQLTAVQKQLSGPTLFHAARPRRKMDYKGIIAELTHAREPRSLMLATPGHAMAAGTLGEGSNKKFYFYDPNFGVATFSSPEAMRRGLEKLFSDKKLPVQYTTHSTDPGRREFEVSVHDNVWKDTCGVRDKTVKDLTEVPLLGASTPVIQPAGPRTPRIPLQPDAASPQPVEVLMGQSHTLTDQTSTLRTTSLSDCSAVVVLSDLKDGVYQKRTLVHLTGSNLAQPVNSASDGFAWLKQVNKDLEGGGKVLFVGGTDTKSVVGVAVVIGQQGEQSGQPLLDLLQRKDVSVTYASSAGVEVYPDGTFKLNDNDGAGVFSQSKVKDIIDFAKD